MNEIWIKWPEVNYHCQNKKIVLFGRSEDWIFKTLPKLSKMPAYIVDSNKGYHGTTCHGLTIFSPSKLNQEDPNNIYVIITAGPHESVTAQLLRDHSQLKPGSHFCCSPAFYDFKLLKEFHNYEKKVLISSPDYEEPKNHRHSRAGGGLFLYEIGVNTIKQIIPGHFRQMIRCDQLIFAVEYVERKVYVLSPTLEVLDKLPLASPNACGIAYSPQKRLVLIAYAHTDTIEVYEKDSFKKVHTIHISDKFKKTEVGQHHINDLCIVDNSLYISCFSLSGNWKRGFLDGGICEYDMDDFSSAPRTLINNLWMPHSIGFYNGNISYLDSMRGLLFVGNHNVPGKFSGFVRGLDYDGRFFYVGQSEDMYTSRLFGISNNIMLNAGFYLFDMEAKASRFYPCLDIMNVHDLLLV